MEGKQMLNFDDIWHPPPKDTCTDSAQQSASWGVTGQSSTSWSVGEHLSTSYTVITQPSTWEEVAQPSTSLGDNVEPSTIWGVNVQPSMSWGITDQPSTSWGAIIHPSTSSGVSEQPSTSWGFIPQSTKSSTITIQSTEPNGIINNPNGENYTSFVCRQIEQNKLRNPNEYSIFEEFILFREKYLNILKTSPHVKCNILETFVKEKSLPYLIILLYPDSYKLLYNIENEVHQIGTTFKNFKNHGLEYILKHQVPTDILIMLQLYGLLSNCYVIINTRRYLSHDDDAKPVTSSFLLFQQDIKDSTTCNKYNDKASFENINILKNNYANYIPCFSYSNDTESSESVNDTESSEKDNSRNGHRSFRNSWYYDTDVKRDALKIPDKYKKMLDKRLDNLGEDDDEVKEYFEELNAQRKKVEKAIKNPTSEINICSHHLKQFTWKYNENDIKAYKICGSCEDAENGSQSNDNAAQEDLERGTLYIKSIQDINDIINETEAESNVQMDMDSRDEVISMEIPI